MHVKTPRGDRKFGYAIKHGIAALSVALLGLTTLGSGMAQAEAGASWKVKGANVGEKLLPSIGIKEIETKYVSLSFAIGTSIVKIQCAGMSLLGARLEAEGKISSGMKFRFTECLLLLDNKIIACPPLNEGKELGVFVTKALKGLLVLHEGKGLIRFEPAAGSVLGMIEFSEECVIGPGWFLSGVLTMKDESLGLETVTHLISQGPLTAMLIEGKYAAVLEGSVVWELTGEHKGLQWSGVPG